MPWLWASTGLPAARKALDRQAQLVGRAGRDAALRQANQQALDPPVALRPMQSLHHRDHRQRLAVQEGEGTGRVLVRQRLAQVEVQHAVGGWRRGLGGGRQRHQEQERHADEEQQQPGEHPRQGKEKLLHCARPKPIGAYAPENPR